MAIASWMKSMWGDSSYRAPVKDEHSKIAEAIIAELEYNIKEYESYLHDKELQMKKQQSQVDYSWLISAPHQKANFEISQLDRFEIESLCQEIKTTECGTIVNLFRSHVADEPPIKEFAGIMRACIIQTIEQRPKAETLSEWASKRRRSLTSIKLRSSSKVSPLQAVDVDDIEMQQKCNDCHTDIPFETQVTYLNETPNIIIQL